MSMAGRTWRRGALVALFGVGLLAGGIAAQSLRSAASGGARLWLEPSELALAAGERARVVVWVEGIPGAGLAAFQVELGFHPEQIELTDPNRGSTAFQPFVPLGGDPHCAWVRGGDSCPDPPWLLTSTGRSAVGTTSVDAAAGRAVIAYGTRGDEAPAGGAGALAVVEVVARTAGRVSLEIDAAILADGAPVPGRYAWTAR